MSTFPFVQHGLRIAVAAVCHGALNLTGQDAHLHFVEEFPAFVTHVEKWTPQSVAEMESYCEEYEKSLRKTKEPMSERLRSEAIFAAMADAFTRSPPIEARALCDGRKLIVEWLYYFIMREKPTPAERARTVEVLALLLNTAAKEAALLRSQGVNPKDGGFWNGVHSTANGPVRPPMPPRMAAANHLNMLNIAMEEAMMIIWGQFQTRDMHKTVEERKAFLLSKGITEKEYGELLLLLPEYDRAEWGANLK